MIRLLLLLFCFTTNVWAAAQPTGFGSVAKHLMEPVGYASDFIYTACLVIGAGLVFASIVKYVEHRRSPLSVTISTVVFLLLAGLFLMALPFAYLLINHGSPYTLFK